MKVMYNFFWFLYKLINNVGKEQFVTDEIKNERLSKCYNCKNLDKSSLLSKIKGPRCGLCGCFVEWKTKFIVEECPDDISQWK